MIGRSSNKNQYRFYAVCYKIAKRSEVVSEAGDGRTAVKLARRYQPDIVVMDISMPELNGLKAAAQLKRIQPDIKILTVTRHTDDAYLQELLQVGVSGYVLKQRAATDAIAAIRAIASGEGYLDPKITGKITAAYAAKANKLTPQQADGLLKEEKLTVIF